MKELNFIQNKIANGIACLPLLTLWLNSKNFQKPLFLVLGQVWKTIYLFHDCR